MKSFISPYYNLYEIDVVSTAVASQWTMLPPENTQVNFSIPKTYLSIQNPVLIYPTPRCLENTIILTSKRPINVNLRIIENIQ